MKVLYLTKYSRKGASSRLRSYQYFPFLEAADIYVTVKPFFDEYYIDMIYAKKKINPFKLLRYYFSRFLTLLTLSKYDKIVIEKELFPYFFSWFERILHLLHINYIVDYDDAIFHNYDLSKNKIISMFLKNKIYNVMKFSHCVVAGNNYLAEKAKKAGAKNIKIIPTVIDTNKYQVKDDYNSNLVVIGWIGSPTTFQYLQSIMPILEHLTKNYNCEIHIVGAKAIGVTYHSSVKFIDWNEKEEVSFIKDFDIGIMPLNNTPWDLGKCSYKLIQYMGCGLPVIASAVGMNKEVVETGKNGYLVSDISQWEIYLIRLIESSVLRKQMGTNGRKKVETYFNVAQKANEWISLLKS